MQKNYLKFSHKYGTVDGLYIDAGKDSPLVIIVNGHNGFYNYGMFPYIQTKLFENRISTYSFNYSHGGVTGDNDYFDDLFKYEQNCMRLEVEDLVCILESRKSSPLIKHNRTYLLAHSLGGVPAAFGLTKNSNTDIVTGLILVSTICTLRFWPPEMIKEWSGAGVLYKKNNRTKQELPQGFEFLQEILQSENNWNIQNNLKKITCPVLIIHGKDDEAVPFSHAEKLYSFINPHEKSKLVPVEEATHTFNTKHPFEHSSPQLEALLTIVINWIQELN